MSNDETHIGITLRVRMRNNGGPLVYATSDELHLVAVANGTPVGQWRELLSFPNGLLVEIRPEILTDMPEADGDWVSGACT